MIMQTLNKSIGTSSEVALPKVKGLKFLGIFNLGPNVVHQRFGDGDATALDKPIAVGQYFSLEPSTSEMEGDVKMISITGSTNIALDFGIGN